MQLMILLKCYLLEFRECFYLFARSGQITSLDELTVVMRSLGMSPTIQELTGYLKGKGGKMSFADFLEVMHIHSRAENLPSEVRYLIRFFFYGIGGRRADGSPDGK
ncbi:unnamed protein product [Diatraea saccharalis]|uniref:Calmodulin-like protein 4 n=1 Tax=Diatraea saccharalis TaxID=40085 RepID=A0A9P0C7X2_9NEOP|nr:unnamed protein product [Diatraea saccharalis]